MVSLHRGGIACLGLYEPNILHNKINKIKAGILIQVEVERKIPLYK